MRTEIPISTEEQLDLARRLYAAFENRDGAELQAVIAESFVGEVTPGLPNGWGGVHRGRDAMVAECWGPVLAKLATRPVPEEFIPTADGRLLVRGTYRGRGRKSDLPHEAQFAHLLSFGDGQIVGLWQLTDSARWIEALA